jgi:lipoprotein-releasing system ATP-binding protein
MLCVVNKNNTLLLEARGLCKKFEGSEQAISVFENINFQIAAGESVSIRGESGCGKSTLLNVLSGLEIADQGELFWQGQPVSGRSISWLAAQRSRFMGFVFQSYYLAPELNALENVLLGARIAGRIDHTVIDRAESLLKRVGLQHRLKHSSTKLSGGERQRVAVARALINDPPLVLADEPTGNLDESTGQAVMELLLDLTSTEFKSLVLVTHNPEYAGRTQRQLTMHLGQLSERA